MLQLLEGFVSAVRFGLEVVTVFALIGGGWIKGESFEKFLFPVSGVLVVLLWGLFVAPKATDPQGPFVKWMTELFCFTVGIIGIYSLFETKWAVIYAGVALADLALVYLLLYITT